MLRQDEHLFLSSKLLELRFSQRRIYPSSSVLNECVFMQTHCKHQVLQVKQSVCTPSIKAQVLGASCSSSTVCFCLQSLAHNLLLFLWKQAEYSMHTNLLQHPKNRQELFHCLVVDVYISCSLYLFNPLLLNVFNHPTERGPFIPLTLHGFSQIRIFKMTCRSAYTLFPRISMKAVYLWKLFGSACTIWLNAHSELIITNQKRFMPS